MFYVAGYRGIWRKSCECSTLPDIMRYGLQRFWIRLMWIVMKMTWADLNLLEIDDMESNLLEIGDAKLLGWAKAISVL